GGIPWVGSRRNLPLLYQPHINLMHYPRDYETLPENHEGMIYVVMIRLMLRRLTNNHRTRKVKLA
ncbi:MAG: hypothetical protein K6T90_14890, partial [Leptolyngbyaceae cyanobacterium HOT.MB2.61]|nr:hypothetical protein [Leptolyngbyaceae cyanobacterium HOT.MB2.61]